MTFNPSIPLNSDSPSIFPAQSQTNYTRLQTIIAADHQFNLTAAANDGYHNLIHMTLQAPTGALASTGRLYVKVASGKVFPFYMDNAGVEYQLAGLSSVVSSPGYTTLPGGVIMQWGSTTAFAGSTQAVAFGLTFPTAVFNVQLTPFRATASPGSSAGFWVSTAGLSTSGFTAVNNTGHSYAYYWVALGN